MAEPTRTAGVVPVAVHFPPLTADFNRGAVNGMNVSAIEDHIDFLLPLFPGEDLRRDDRIARCGREVAPRCHAGTGAGRRDHALDGWAHTATAMGVEEVLTAPRSPWLNQIARGFR
jgi:hypothetical protein